MYAYIKHTDSAVVAQVTGGDDPIITRAMDDFGPEGTLEEIKFFDSYWTVQLLKRLGEAEHDMGSAYPMEGLDAHTCDTIMALWPR